MKFNSCLLWLLGTAALAGGCAVEETTSANEDEKMFLEAWIKTHHPEAELAGMGIYILSDTPSGEGKSVTKPCYARVKYTVRNLDGDISNTSDEDIAKQLGTYNKSYYYGPRVWNVADGAISKGLEDMLYGMTEKSSRTAMIPGWFLTYNRYGSEEEYMREVTDNSAQIYDVTIEEVTDDIMQWQVDQIESYLDSNGPSVEPQFTGFYFRVDEAGEGEAEDLHKDTTVFINYTGMRLDGQVFDTTVEKTAIDNDIYDESRTYEPMEVQMSADSTDITLDGNSTIAGFRSILWRMKAMEKATGIFYSAYGYGSSGSGSTIPEYAPLIFRIELVEDPDAEDAEDSGDDGTTGETTGEEA